MCWQAAIRTPACITSQEQAISLCPSFIFIFIFIFISIASTFAALLLVVQTDVAKKSCEVGIGKVVEVDDMRDETCNNNNYRPTWSVGIIESRSVR